MNQLDLLQYGDASKWSKKSYSFKICKEDLFGALQPSGYLHWSELCNPDLEQSYSDKLVVNDGTKATRNLHKALILNFNNLSSFSPGLVFGANVSQLMREQALLTCDCWFVYACVYYG